VNTNTSSDQTKRPGGISRLMLRAGGAIHRFMYRRGLARRMGALQVILLTTIGRKTGRSQTVPINGVAEGDGFVVIGSNSGSDLDPGWWLNLVANPNASIQVNDLVTKVRMEPVTDPAERSRLWAKTVASMPRYAGYEKKTKRVIPLGVLRPV
jgi:deazaflavin-dependent oxidoreductase (nitroreductase family)